jgi:hypothetical protein
VVRDIIDRELADGDPLPDHVKAGFAELTERYDELVDGLFEDDPELRIDR